MIAGIALLELLISAAVKPLASQICGDSLKLAKQSLKYTAHITHSPALPDTTHISPSTGGSTCEACAHPEWDRDELAIVGSSGFNLQVKQDMALHLWKVIDYVQNAY
jgi:hypothetical protein